MSEKVEQVTLGQILKTIQKRPILTIEWISHEEDKVRNFDEMIKQQRALYEWSEEVEGLVLKLQKQDQEKMRQLGKFFCAWNSPDINKTYREAPKSKINGDRIAYRIFHLFHDDVLKVWREYITIPRKERINFLLDTVTDLKKGVEEEK
jgi:hypothetical protein